jgi:hypothetical protein
VPLLATALIRLGRLERGRRILNFDRVSKLDVVVTTSDVRPPAIGIETDRPLTGYGQLRGVGSCTRAMSRLYRHKRISLHFSRFLRADGKLDSDLVLLGGPLKNQWSKTFLDDLVRHYEMRTFEFDEQRRNIRIDVTGFDPFEVEAFAPEMEDARAGGLRYPKKDYGLIILSHHKGRRAGAFRWVMCAGITTYGTAAAADYLFGELVQMPRRRARVEAGVRSFPGKKTLMLVVEADLSEGEVKKVSTVASFRLRRAKAVKPKKALQPA